MELSKERIEAITAVVLGTDPAQFETRQQALDFLAEQGVSEEEVMEWAKHHMIYMLETIEALKQTWQQMMCGLLGDFKTYMAVVEEIYEEHASHE